MTKARVMWSDYDYPRQYLEIDRKQYGSVDRVDGKWVGTLTWYGEVASARFESNSEEDVKRDMLAHLLEHHRCVVDAVALWLENEP
jgi:hypothetical protein